MVLRFNNGLISTKTFTIVLILILAVFCIPYQIQAQGGNTKRIVAGQVVDEAGDPLVGVTVMVEGSTRGTFTDLDGGYSVEVMNDNETLSFVYIGFASQKQKVGDRKTIDIKLLEESQLIEEIVVVGYGLQKKETVTGAIASLSTDDLIQAPVANVSNALAGKVSGLMAVQSNGEPGNNQSRLNIRGLGTMVDSSPLILVDGVERETMNDLDPNEIETLNVLKDASATAVFGVKGANGVILITTRTGATGKAKVSMTANFGLQTPINLPDLLNSYDYAVLKNEALLNDGKATIFTETDLEHFLNGTDPVFHSSKDWISEYLKSAAMQGQYNVNVSGGTDVAKYFVSFGYMFQDGLYDSGGVDMGFSSNPKYERYNFRSNFDFNITKKLSTSIKVGASFTNSNYPNGNANSFFYNILSYAPFSSPGIMDGKIVSGFVDDPMGQYNIENRGQSPYSKIISSGYKETFGNKLNINWGFNYDLDIITKGLSARLMLAYDNEYSQTSVWSKTIDQYNVAADANDPSKYHFIQKNYDGNFGFSESQGKRRQIYFEGGLYYNKTFGDHTVTALTLFNRSKEHLPSLAYGVPASLQGVVGRITYAYKSKYLMEYNVGYNGSEQFPEGKRYGYFPAYSLGWVLTEESFIPENDILSFAKIRGSYGEVGNDKTASADRFLYLPNVYTFENGQNNGYWFGQRGENLQKYTGAKEGKSGNPIVTWERAKKFNIGVDLKFFKNQLSISGDYFMERRNDILWERETVPDYVAIDLPVLNIGRIKNSGFEVESSWFSKIREFNYWAKGNVSFARNKILYQDEALMPYYWMNKTGYSVNQYKAYRTNGFYNYTEDVVNRPYYNFSGNSVQRGDLKYIDVNGDGIVDQNDEVPTGFTSEIPEIIYGLSLGASYKGFDFSVLFQGVGNSTKYLNEMAGWAFDWNWRSTLSKFKERWSVERFENGERITQARLASNGTESVNSKKSDFMLHNADYLRLKTLELGYTIPSRSLKKIGISSLRVYLTGSNLLTFTSLKDVDPESTRSSGSYYPLTRVYNVGVNVQF